ncbi:beta carbonic anhydrase 5, chloroplastic-like isoform X2 [Herrania umbratica]|uniref:Carbonic anhydrase n=1 Tax=Herrania umbratica TaxID=108875 RepID=A0A6J1AFB0_9ROSI|nr:beta carbonic anhydrase 5, chloroplastic-like isoform X2 [Herrania umbratica]
MAWLIRSKARLLVSATRPLRAPVDSFHCSRFSDLTDHSVFSFPRKWLRSKARRLNDVDDNQSGSSSSPHINRRTTVSQLEVSSNSRVRVDLFDELKQRFLSFKEHKYLEELEHFQTLKEAQSPKFMVIACADSRVCPSTILGFRPGEAFMIRNVANLVPPFENGPSETNAALEFAVKTLEVENILIIGHSCCGGIQTLMSMRDDGDSSFIKSWVTTGTVAKLRTEAAANHLSFDQQCRLCEKESINRSLLNLLTYSWIEDRVRKGLLFVHGGYYDFLNCTFEKWTLDFKGSSGEEGARLLVKDQELWC